MSGTSLGTMYDVSDERVKFNVEDIDDSLDKLMKLKPKQYILSDDKNNRKCFGMIAQDVKKEFEEFVTEDPDYIANVLSNASIKGKIITCEKTILELKENDEVKILLNNENSLEINMCDTSYNNRYKRRIVKIKKIINEYSFEINEDIKLDESEYDKLFVYGAKKQDFLKTDYQSLYNLNIAATQEIYKIIKQQQEQINELKIKLKSNNIL